MYPNSNKINVFAVDSHKLIFVFFIVVYIHSYQDDQFNLDINRSINWTWTIYHVLIGFNTYRWWYLIVSGQNIVCYCQLAYIIYSSESRMLKWWIKIYVKDIRKSNERPFDGVGPFNVVVFFLFILIGFTYLPSKHLR